MKKKCIKCGRLRYYKAKGLCDSCYQVEWNKQSIKFHKYQKKFKKDTGLNIDGKSHERILELIKTYL